MTRRDCEVPFLYFLPFASPARRMERELDLVAEEVIEVLIAIQCYVTLEKSSDLPKASHSSTVK